MVATTGCHSEEALDDMDAPKRRLVVVYMLADNNLDLFALQDLNEMEAGFPANTDDKLVVYVDRGQGGTPSHPYLMEIVHDESDQVVSPILRSFPEQNSADARVLNAVLEETFARYRGETFTSTGLVLWSHGNAWLPDGVAIPTYRDNVLEEPTRSFGLDDDPQASRMDIQQLAKALERYSFDFLLFDACFMSAIEVIYELRHAVKYTIASPTEVLSDGYPYEHVAPLFFERLLNPQKIAQAYVEHYDSQPGALRSASVAVIKMDEVETLTQKIYDLTAAWAAKKAKAARKDSVLQLDRLDGEWIYDLRDFLEKTALKNDLEAAYKSFVKQWQQTVVYADHTPFMVETIDLERCHGVSVYIPDTTHKKAINEYYKTLSWFTASGYDNVFAGF